MSAVEASQILRLTENTVKDYAANGKLVGRKAVHPVTLHKRWEVLINDEVVDKYGRKETARGPLPVSCQVYRRIGWQDNVIDPHRDAMQYAVNELMQGRQIDRSTLARISHEPAYLNDDTIRFAQSYVTRFRSANNEVAFAEMRELYQNLGGFPWSDPTAARKLLNLC